MATRPPANPMPRRAAGLLLRRWPLAFWLVLALPGMRAWLESSMALHMLVQMPLLAVLGYGGAAGLGAAARARLCMALGGALPLVLAALLASSYWMLPRALDAALGGGWAETAKFVSLPLLVGAPLALAWPRLGSIARGFVWTNAFSMLAVLGWLYMAAPVRVCNNYLESAQYDAGRWMVLAAVGGFIAWMLYWMAGAEVRE